MDVTVLCIRLLTELLLFLITQTAQTHSAQKDVSFPRVVPDKLQFFEYDTVSVYCDETDATEWRVMRQIKDTKTRNYSDWETSAQSCITKPAFSRHSGKYWCENKRGERSDTVNITITGDSVILESPVHPVMEGSSVILRCRKKKNASSSIAEFFKDGVQIKTGYRGEMSITNVSVSDQGFYKCNISGAGESPESLLAVKSETQAFNNPNQQSSTNPFTSLWIVSILLVTLLTLTGILHCQRVKAFFIFLSGKSPSELQTCDDHAGGDSPVDAPIYAIVKKQKGKAEPELEKECPSSHLPDDIYSLIS